MKAKLDFKSKRTIIIAAIIAALAVGAGIGGYFYAKGNNEASATTNVSDGGQTTTEQPSGNNNKGKSDSKSNNGNENGETTPTDGTTGDNAGNNGTANDGANANGNAGNAGNTGGAANAGGAGTAGAANNGAANGGAGAGNAGAQAGDNDGGDATTTTEDIVVENPWESHETSWRPQTLNVSTPEVNVNENKITVTKTTTTSTGNKSVSAGDTITYTITVTNNNTETLNSLYISDEIPEGTTFDSIENGGETIKENDVVTKVYWNLWNLGIEAGKTYSVSFKVTVNKDAKGTIKNVALVENNKTNETKDPVIKSNKIASLVEIVEDEEGNEVENITDLKDKKVKEGQIVRYTITVENTSKDEKAITKVSDNVPEGTTLEGEAGEEVTVVNGKKTTTYAIEKLNEGINLTIAEEGKATIYFDVKVNKETPKYIKNIAVVGGETPTTENEVYTDIDISKTWDDADDQDGKRPNEITVVLNKTIGEKTEEVKKATVTSRKGWKYTFENLPKYDGETEIVYTVEEELTDVVTGTDAAGTYKVETTGDYKTGITIKNTHTPEKIEVEATKQYEDNNNQDGIREDAKFNLYKQVGNNEKVKVENSTKTISKDATGEGLVAKWNDLPKYENGEEITYTVEEELTKVVTGTDAAGTYKVETTGDYKTGITIKNTHTPEKIEVEATKQYNDNNNQDGIREDATFNLYKQVGNDEKVKVENSTKTISKDATGEELVAKWDNLPKYENGEEITYTVEEELTDVVTGTDAAGTYKVETTGDYKTGITIKNTHTPEKIEVEATKQYEDNNNQDGIREDAIFNLYKQVGNNEKVKVENSTKTISKDATGEELVAKWNNLPKYENGDEITYTVEEELTDVVTGTDAAGTYKVETTGDYKTGITIKNIHTPETTEATVKKVWNDSDNKDGKRPTELKVTLSNKTEVTLNDANGWTATVKDLPKYANGTEIVYTWTEEDLTDYELISTNKVGTVTTITNIILKPDISVTKKQYMYNSETKKYEEIPNGTEVRTGDEVVYLLTATNNGNKEGKTSIRDPKPDNAVNIAAWIDSNENCIKDSGETSIDLAKLNGNGTDPIAVPANSKVVIAYKVKVDGYANEEVTNTAHYTNEGEKEKKADETRIVKIEDDMEIIPTTSEGGDPIPHTVVLVLDYSSSMEGNRLRDLKNALKGTNNKAGFFESYFGGKGATGNGNKLYITTYSSSASTPTLVTSYDEAVRVVDSASTSRGTNTIAGLEKAKTISDTDKNISVVLMTDGEPTYDENGTFVPFGSKEINTQTVATAKTITDHGNPMYVIGFGIGTTEEIPVDFVQKMTSEDGPKAHYYSAENAASLATAFETVVTEIINSDGDHITESSENGIIKIKEGFTKGQDIEIYKGNYTEGESSPYDTFTWNDFFATGYAAYDETHKVITFKLGEYMEDEGMDTDEQVSLRFVAEGTAGKKTKSTKRSLKNVIPPSDPIPTYKGETTSEKEEEKKTVKEETKSTKKESKKIENNEEKKSSKETSEVKETVKEEKETTVETNKKESSKEEEKTESKETNETDNSKQEEVKQEEKQEKNEENKVQEETKSDVSDDVNTELETTEKE